MSTIFSKIAAGEIPSYKCAEDDKFYAFLDINPIAKGHTLVIPRREVDYIFDMDDEELAEYHLFAKKVAIALKRAFPARKWAWQCSASKCRTHTYTSFPCSRKRT